MLERLKIGDKKWNRKDSKLMMIPLQYHHFFGVFYGEINTD